MFDPQTAVQSLLGISTGNPHRFSKLASLHELAPRESNLMSEQSESIGTKPDATPPTSFLDASIPEINDVNPV